MKWFWLPTGPTVVGSSASDQNAVEAQVNANTDAIASILGGSTWPFPMARNTIAAVGDSMTARNSGGQGASTAAPVAYQPFLNPTYFNLLPIMTYQRIRHSGEGGMYAVSSSWVNAQHDLQLPVVLAMDPLACCVAGLRRWWTTRHTASPPTKVWLNLWWRSCLLPGWFRFCGPSRRSTRQVSRFRCPTSMSGLISGMCGFAATRR